MKHNPTPEDILRCRIAGHDWHLSFACKYCLRCGYIHAHSALDRYNNNIKLHNSNPIYRPFEGATDGHNTTS